MSQKPDKKDDDKKDRDKKDKKDKKDRDKRDKDKMDKDEEKEKKPDEKTVWHFYRYGEDNDPDKCGFYVSSIGIGPSYQSINRDSKQKLQDWEGYDTRVFQKIPEENLVRTSGPVGSRIAYPKNPRFEESQYEFGKEMIAKLQNAYDAAKGQNPGPPLILEIKNDEKMPCNTWPIGSSHVELEGSYYEALPTLERISWEWQKAYEKRSGRQVEPLHIDKTLSYYTENDDTLKKIGVDLNVPLKIMSALNQTLHKGVQMTLCAKLHANTLVVVPNPPGSGFEKRLYESGHAVMKIVASPLDRDEKKRDKKRPQEFTETAVKEDKAHVKKTRSTQKQDNFLEWKNILGQAQLLSNQLNAQHSSIPPPESVKRMKLLLIHHPDLPALVFTMPSDSSVQDTVDKAERLLEDEGFDGNKKVKYLKNADGDRLSMFEQIKNVLEEKDVVVPEYEVVAQPTCNGGAAK